MDCRRNAATGDARFMRYDVWAMTRERFELLAADRNARASGRSRGRPIQRLLFLTKI
jgi:hypothetical protein